MEFRIWKIKKTFIFIIFAVLFFSWGLNTVKAQLLSTQPYTPTDFSMSVGDKKTVDTDGDSFDDVLVEYLSIGPDGRPVIQTTSLKPSEAGGSQYAQAPFIAQYIQSMYKYAIMIITLLATILIIVAGVQWTMSGGSADKISGAKQMIARSLTGLVIALGSYTLLYTINPDLVEFKNLQVLKIAAVAEIPEDRTMPEGAPVDPPTSLATLTEFTEKQIIFGPKLDKRAAPAVKAALESALDEFANSPSTVGVNVDVIISTAYRSPQSQYELMVAQCGCKTVDELLNPKDTSGNKTDVKDVPAGEWSSYCTRLTDPVCKKIGFKSLAFTGGKFQAPDMGHFAGNALDISVALTGAVKPCGDISVDALARKSASVTNAGQWKDKEWCIPKQQQLLIKSMLNKGFCVGLADGSSLREPWHFEYMSGTKTSESCTNAITDPNLAKLEYLQDIK